ncbi:ABC transporter ATP-binding protein [Jeotgalibacillus terrae]|uniref:ABC transporter ATP-binding protein n=1 Tax=Jeotgalibacillus terrae TaxID=587735 RepID=A0ABW5ZI90_9BACL|nr:ABC transporter ATP-binding protein [Jeotgalibacillus terrae]MBM7578331.1 ATP-binding cassette subfamily B protein/subfamily B ATP-binding cassette protein MsbA [Jeotgalibacillus terrae]
MDVFKKLKEFYWPHKRYFILSIIFLFVMTLITIVYPIILQITIDDVVGQGRYGLIPYLAFGFIGIMAIKGIATFISQYNGDLFGIIAVYDLRERLYDKLQSLPFQYYDNAKTGDIMSRLTADVEGFRFFLSFGFAELIRLVLLLIVTTGVMLYYSVPLTIVTMLSIPFLAVAVFKFDKKVHPAFRGVRKSFGKLNTNVQENISGINTVKSLSREEHQIDKFNSSNQDYKEKYLFTSDVWAKYFPLMEFLGNVSVVMLLGYGGYLVVNDSLTAGELTAFYSLVGFIIWPIMNLGFTINQFSQSKASGERLLEILEAEETIIEKPDAIEMTRSEGVVEFKNVTLRYTEDDEKAINNISFKAESGKTIGLIGATGSGKTSVTQLMTRFYEPTEGSVMIDGREVSDYTIRSLRKNVGFVLQESFLFSSTIKANIAFGRPEATMDEIISAAKKAEAHDFIMEMPDGYDTMLGERGLGLSGGQKQRIAISRAICLDPSILILDDATSAVDMQTEFNIQKALKEVMEGRTTFIIAHRISSLKHADEIFVFENGEITHRGTHEELIKLEGQYKRIYDIQYKDQKTLSATGMR